MEDTQRRYSIVGASVEDVVAAGGDDVREARASKIIFATLSEAQAAKLERLGYAVTKTGAVTTLVEPPVGPPVPAAAIPMYEPAELVKAVGMDEVRQLLRPPLYGSGTFVAVVDTGIRESHERLQGRVVYSKNFTTDPMRDGFDHGTGNASILLSVAPLCNILNFKVIGDSGEGTEEDSVMAIEECLLLHDEGSVYAPQVINFSLGIPDTGDPNNSIRVACRAAIERGLWVFAAAGNSGPSPGTIMSPACEERVGAIGSCGLEPFIISGFSSRGPTEEGLTKPDVVMFGEGVIMASSLSDTATVAKSGTSFSTPFVSGLGALYYEGMTRLGKVELVRRSLNGEYPSIVYLITEPYAIEALLPSIGIKPEGVAAAKDNDYGYGLIWGSLAKRTMAAEVVPAIDIASLLPIIILVPMIGMMSKVGGGE